MSPQRALADLQPGDHVAWLYETEDEQQAVITAFVRLGLERGEKVLCVTGDQPGDAILAWLRAAGLDVAPHLASGQLEIMSAPAVEGPEADVARLVAAVEGALAAGHHALRITVDMVQFLGDRPAERLTEYERVADPFFAHGRCLALCQYDRRRCDAAVLLQAVATQPTIIIGTSLYRNAHRAQDPARGRARLCPAHAEAFFHAGRPASGGAAARARGDGPAVGQAGPPGGAAARRVAHRGWPAPPGVPAGRPGAARRGGGGARPGPLQSAPVHRARPGIAGALVDPLRLEQVLTNLIDNALKFSPEDRPVEVELSTDGVSASLAVRDHGIGIPSERHQRVFERYHQIQTGQPGSGFGLGLYIAQRIVALHGGRIDVERPADGGTRFVVTLPLGLGEKP